MSAPIDQSNPRFTFLPPPVDLGDRFLRETYDPYPARDPYVAGKPEGFYTSNNHTTPTKASDNKENLRNLYRKV